MEKLENVTKENQTSLKKGRIYLKAGSKSKPSYLPLLLAVKSEAELIKEAIKTAKDESISKSTRIKMILDVLPNDQADRFSAYVAKTCVQKYSSGARVLRLAVSVIHDYLEGKVFKKDLSKIRDELSAFHQRSVVAHVVGYKDLYTPRADEALAKMLIVIIRTIIDSELKNSAFTTSCLAFWVAAISSEEEKDLAETEQLKFIVRLLERPWLKSI